MAKRIKADRHVPRNVQAQIMNERFGKVNPIMRDRRERRLKDARRIRSIMGED